MSIVACEPAETRALDTSSSGNEKCGMFRRVRMFGAPRAKHARPRKQRAHDMEGLPDHASPYGSACSASTLGVENAT